MCLFYSSLSYFRLLIKAISLDRVGLNKYENIIRPDFYQMDPINMKIKI